VVKVKVIRQSCFATEVRGSARHLSGNENYPKRREERRLVLTDYGQFASSGQVVRSV